MSSANAIQRVEILVFDGVDELDVVAPFEILVSAGFDVGLVTLERCPSITGAHGMTATPQATLGLHLIERANGRDAALNEPARIEHQFDGPILATVSE